MIFILSCNGPALLNAQISQLKELAGSVLTLVPRVNVGVDCYSHAPQPQEISCERTAPGSASLCISIRSLAGLGRRAKSSKSIHEGEPCAGKTNFSRSPCHNSHRCGPCHKSCTCHNSHRCGRSHKSCICHKSHRSRSFGIDEFGRAASCLVP